MPTMETVGRRADAEEPHHLYQGEKESASALAQVSVVGQGGRCFIEEIDGVDRRSASWSDRAFVYLKPGEHHLKVRYKFGDAMFVGGQVSDLVDITPDLRANHTYALHFVYADQDQREVRFRLIDYGVNVPRRCVNLGLRDGGPSAPSVISCIRGDRYSSR